MRKYSLDDKYQLESGTVYMSGIQALVRLPLEQMRRDRLRGLKTAALITGYEGSPLGGYDLALERVVGLLAEHNIRFQPGVNEDLAATAVMGSQMLETMPDAQFDGVVGIWYGKGPGVDRSGDALRHANLAGTGTYGGALALAGDDHVSKSSTIPHQSELSFYNVGMPILSPGSTQEILDYGLYGIEMSRFSGAWTGLKLATDICDGGETIEVSPERCAVEIPEFLVDGEPYRKKIEPLLIVPNTWSLERELLYTRLDAVRLFARANKLNRIVARHDRDRLGIVATGKAYYDLQSALRNIGLDDEGLARAGIRILKLGLVFPLEPRIIDEFVEGLDELLVIEEKRSFVELQLREMLYNRERRPSVLGKTAPGGEMLLGAHMELDAEQITRVLGRWLSDREGFQRRIEQLDEVDGRSTRGPSLAARGPSYCSGCPHNRSTLVLEGQIAGGGIGCHGMAARLQDAGRGIAYIGHMGSEGAHWIGMAPFSGRKHIFQNLGDGTYFHSGRQAVLAAIASDVNISYKILFNGAVAMTGGQQAAGGFGIPQLTRELEADGVRRIFVLAEDPSTYDGVELAAAAELRPRERLEETLRELEQISGVSVMIYDQMCAAEKRRRRSRGRMPQPQRRLMINERICEGCGDCVKQSNCVSLRPVETAYGPKMRIHQSSCNVDYSCLLGDCPSFASVMIEEGTGLKRRPVPDLPEADIPDIRPSRIDQPYHILMPGVGGTGVVTINALLATAALLDGLHAVTLDQTGLAQKGGAVVSHLTLSPTPIETSNRISYAATDLLLGFDITGAAAAINLKRASADRSTAVINTYETLTGAAIRAGLTVLSPEGQTRAAIDRFTRSESNLYVDASQLAEQLFGSHLQTNIFLTGAAWQAGLIPMSRRAIEEAIRLNGVAVEKNLQAFAWGRVWVADRAKIEALIGGTKVAAAAQTTDELIEARAAELTAYQNAAYAERYRGAVARVRALGDEITRAVAENLFKLMAYKDEYEVARLLIDPEFERRVEETFEAPRKIVYHLHPPALRSLGVARKLSIGTWAKPLFGVLAGLKFLRGGAFDPFGYLPSRRQERELIRWYEQMIEELVAAGAGGAVALEIARAPEGIRGYEGVKAAAVEKVQGEVAEKLAGLARRTAA